MWDIETFDMAIYRLVQIELEPVDTMVAWISLDHVFTIHKIQHVDYVVVLRMGLDQVIFLLVTFH
jgi:hypothetical protein